MKTIDTSIYMASVALLFVTVGVLTILTGFPIFLWIWVPVLILITPWIERASMAIMSTGIADGQRKVSKPATVAHNQSAVQTDNSNENVGIHAIIVERKESGLDFWNIRQ